MHHRHGFDRERTDLDRLAVDVEVELLGHPRLRRQPVRRREPLRRTGRPPHRKPRLRSARVVAAQHVIAAEVQAVVGVQVGQEDRVHLQRVDVAVECAERAVAEVEQDPPGTVARSAGSTGPSASTR